MVCKEWEEEEMGTNGRERDGSGAGYGEKKGRQEEEEVFDPGMQPPFSIGEIRAAIPGHCWVKSPWRSMSYVVRDVAAAVGLAAAAAYLDSGVVWPLYWFAQGTMFWAIFVLGHECGHGSFSDSKKLNSVVGHILHSFILVPYHGWRISHRTHHQNHGHVENDESWQPLTEKMYRSLGHSSRKIRFTFPYPMFAFPVYLLYRSPGKTGSHFSPYSDLFAPREREAVATSTLCWTAMALLLAGMMWVLGSVAVIKLYWVPTWWDSRQLHCPCVLLSCIFVMWLDLVTYLHHHGHEQRLPWYRGKEWNYLRGALTTVDRDYGWINNVHHDIGTHVIHHIFPQIPHYHLREATEAATPVLGKYYREPKKSGPLPFHLIGSFSNSLKKDHFVSDTGDVVYYQRDPRVGGNPEMTVDEAKSC